MTRTTKSRRRAKSNLIHKARWAGYATAAAATAVAGHETADADPIPSGPQNIVVKAQPSETMSVVMASASVDLDMDTVADFKFLHVATGTYANSGRASIMALNSNRIRGFFAGSSTAYVSNLPSGAIVSSGNPTFLPAGGYGNLASYSGYPNSQFRDAAEGFIGVQFNSMLGTRFGWIRVEMDGVPVNSLTIKDWAFGMPDQPVPVPEAGSLGLLACGAGGLLAWRRKRRHAALEKAE